ncbi:MAG: hypothetical protein Kow0074_23390 [Candidatus Zixiibacteriota bacterium]
MRSYQKRARGAPVRSPRESAKIRIDLTDCQRFIGKREARGRRSFKKPIALRKESSSPPGRAAKSRTYARLQYTHANNNVRSTL